MLLSINWLKEFITLNVPLEEIAEKLTVTGTEIEEIIRPCANVKGVRIAKIVKAEQHPTKSGLLVTHLDVGEDEYPLCVTTAKNVALGDVIPWFAPGSSTIGGMVLGYRDFDGFNSAGMMCSAKELGVPELSDVNGILQLPKDAPLGADAGEWLGLDDTVFDVSVTPNRGDLLSILGMALEIHALFPECELHIPEVSAPAYEGEWTRDFDGVSIGSDGCRAYRLGMADSVKVVPSPLQIGVRLCMSGMRPVNAIVDATNYAMLAFGQPLHAFDAASLPGNEITVRTALENEKIKTLDEKDYKLGESDLLITSDNVPVALAGVMGGANSEITEKTEHVLLESANFAAPFVAKTSRRLGIPSEAAYRYARGVDPTLTEKSMNYALSLMEEWGGVRAFARNIYVENCDMTPISVPLTAAKMKRILKWGDMDEAVAILDRLGIKKLSGDSERAEFAVPARRSDIAIEEDLIEEVGRVHGYNSIPSSIPVLYGPGILNDTLRQQRALRGTMLGRGYTEAITISFISEEDLKRIRYPESESAGCRRVANPISVEMTVMRPTLLPALLNGVSKAVRGGWRDPIRMFEIGRAFVPGEKDVSEVQRICGISFCGTERRTLYKSDREDLLLVKSDIEALADACNVKLSFRQSRLPHGHAGQTAEIFLGDRKIGYMMCLKPEIGAELDLDMPLYAFELDLKPMMDAPLPSYRKASSYPPVYRDVSLLAGKNVAVADVIAAIREIAGDLLSTVRLFDIYEGKGVPEDMRSLTFSMAYHRDDRTLRDKEVEEEHNLVRKGLEKKGFTLR